MTENAIDTALDAIRHTDIYIIDMILKRYFNPAMRVLDAGCGMGRNVEYFLRMGYDVCAADIAEDDVRYLAGHARTLNPALPQENFRVEPLEGLTYAPESFDVLICSAVLHFARDDAHFNAMLNGVWHMLKPGGIFFARLATSIGIEKRITPLENRRFLLPDGSRRYLADETMLLQHTHRLGASFLEPLKTTNVQNSRCMTTWVLKKNRG